MFNTRIAQANLITKTDFDAKLSNLNRKTTANKTKQYIIMYYFVLSKNYYVFQPLFKYLEVAHISNIAHIFSWKSRGLRDINIKAIATNKYLLNG